MTAYDCFAIAAPGLEPIVARELAALGVAPAVEEGGASWTGDARSLFRANLWLRAASRVVVRVARFRATAFHELERSARRVPWDRFGGTPEFRVTARKSRLRHTGAIAERLAEAASRAPGAGTRPHAAAQLWIVRVLRDEFELSVDASGELLHLRGYRQEQAKAPLRETLAAALLLSAGYDGDAPLVDPFCGSGTIPIEGALIARRIAPGIGRAFALEQWAEFDAALASREREAARAGARTVARAPIRGSDRDAGAIRAARANATRAGVAADIVFEQRALSSIDAIPPGGLVATNPPYGVRVGAAADVRDLYARFGHMMRERAGHATVAMYLPAAHLGRQTGLDLDVLYKTSNGGLPVAAARAAVSS